MMPRWTRLVLVPFVFAACGDPPVPVVPPSPGPQPPAPTTSASALAATTAAPSALPTNPPHQSRARVGAPIDGRFGHALSCKVTDSSSDIVAWPVGKGLLGTCGTAVNAAGVFYIAENGQLRLAPEVFKDLPMASFNSGGYFGLYQVSGPDLEHLQATIGDMASRTGQYQLFRKNGKQWQKATGDRGLSEGGGDGGCWGWCVKVEGHPLVESNRSGQFRYNDDHKGWTPGRASVPGCNENVHDFALLFVQAKELWGVGTACGKSVVLRSTIGGSDTTAQSLDLPAFHGFQGRLHPAADRWIYEGGGGRILALFDGKTWSPLKSFSEERSIDVRTVSGKTWIWTRNELYGLNGAKLDEVYVPDERIDTLSFSESGELRVWTGKGLYMLDADTTWHPVSLPSGTTKMQQLRHLGGRWVYQAEAKDDDKLGQLFVEGASGIPLLIVDPRPAISPMAYVRPIDVFVDGMAARAVGGPAEGYHRGCEAPFAMLYKLSKGAPKDYDFPATKQALVGHVELQAGRFSEVEAFGDRYLVAQFDGPQSRQRLSELVQLVKKEVKGSTPQLLCADEVPNGLPTTRSVNMK